MAILLRRPFAILGGFVLFVAACAGPAATTATPAPSATARLVPSSPPAGAVSSGALASTRPSPVVTAASPQSSPAATIPAGSTAATPIPPEQPLAAESNPPGDIADNQVFVIFASPAGGYRLQVPEGWARTDTGADVRFISKLDGVQVVITRASTAPTAASARTAQVTDLQRTGRAVHVNNVQDVHLPMGAAVQVDYSSNSDPDPVTGKQIRLENNAYLFYSNGKIATLTLWAPLGADNVDQWQQMAQSFQWQ